MTTRDRLVVLVMAMLAIVAGVWIEVVSPERSKAQEAQTQVESARASLLKAQQSAAADHALSAKLVSVRRYRRGPGSRRPGAEGGAADHQRSLYGDGRAQRAVHRNCLERNSRGGCADERDGRGVDRRRHDAGTFQIHLHGELLRPRTALQPVRAVRRPRAHRGDGRRRCRLVVFNTLTLQALQESGKKEAKNPLLQGTVTATAFTAPSTAPGSGTSGSKSAPATSGAAGTSGASPALVAGGKP